MNLRQYKYFVEVAGQLSFSRAAERLNVSQSALSRQIQLLEIELALKLFDRIGRGIALTQAGRDLYPRCRAILNDAELIALRAGELTSGTGGQLRIGSTPPALESVVSAVLVGFRRRFPDLNIVLIEDSAAQLAEYLDEGRLDLAVMGLTIASPLTSRALFQPRAMAVVPPGHSFFGRSKIGVNKLAAEPLLLLKSQYVTRQVFDVACHAAGIHPQIFLESDSPHSLLNLVRSGLGIAIVPSNLLLGDLKPNAIQLQLNDKPLEFVLSVVWDPRRYMSPSAEAFADELQILAGKRTQHQI
ncbi:MAG: LysR family transcriptional regulator [Alphaproteobacteria bacterium]|nr:LysR family transcriptional regulator [Alphaproteobacteria bacterium]